MEKHWEQIKSIQMSLQTAELNLDHVENKKQLHLSCSLVNIARGKCNLLITEKKIKTNAPKGSLHISAERAIMKGNIEFSEVEFKQLVDSLTLPYVRPIILIIGLIETLPVSIEGILYIDKDKDYEISTISTVFPLK